MKVAMLTPWLTKCGIFSYSWHLTHALAKQDCDVYVVRLYRFGNKDAAYYQHFAEEVPLDVDIIHVQHEYGLYSWLDLQFYSTLRTKMQLLNKTAPIITTMHSAGNIKVDRVIYMNSQAIIVHNYTQKEMFKHACEIIPMGVQRVKPPPAPDLCKRRWGVEGNTVGFFGFISEYKGVENVIRALANIPDATLLVGGGWHVDAQTPYMTSIKLYANQLMPGRVRWLGYVSEEDLPYYFGACDIMVYAHLIISESMAVNTALAYGKPTIASNLPAFREKEHRNVLITFKNVEDLTNKINALLKEPELCEMLTYNAKAYAEANSWSVAATKHIKLYQETIEACNASMDNQRQASPTP